MKLSPKTTLDDFENHYWYASDLKAFAKQLGVSNSSKMRKDQLEALITHYLKTGKLTEIKTKPKNDKQAKDCVATLTMETPVKNYTSNKITKTFILAEAEKLSPNLPKKSGVWYWINRWREQQLEQGSITYGDIVKEFVALSTKKEKLPRIPSTKFNNFITDFLAANKGTRADAMDAWEQLKTQNIPKTFDAWNANKDEL